MTETMIKEKTHVGNKNEYLFGFTIFIGSSSNIYYVEFKRQQKSDYREISIDLPSERTIEALIVLPSRNISCSYVPEIACYNIHSSL